MKNTNILAVLTSKMPIKRVNLVFLLTSTALIPRQINMRKLKHKSPRHKLWFSYAYATRH